MDATRDPIATYEQAIRRLVRFLVAEKCTPEQLDLAVQIVADIWWLSDEKVRHDMQKSSRELYQDAPKPIRRRRFQVGAAGSWGH